MPKIKDKFAFDKSDRMIKVNEREIKNLEMFMKRFSKLQIAQMWSEGVKQHTKLVKWLYDNHKDILRRFEKENYGGMRTEFLEDKKQEVKHGA